ncbi:universal stress family protein [Halosolutus amylolyticus]|uniref:Universal stress family protein n=1 Tax=Halosolutus amylolyticus TaxID=2932267 RepID=A0ABD5PSD0_9EURY|nr:universal stress family protein [Halosolutus amylolyticus]
MTRTALLVPIRYPPNTASVETVTHAIDLAEGFDDVHLFILHVNVLHRGEDVDRTELRQAVEDEIDPLANATCHVRDAYLIENAILDEAAQQDVDYVVIGESMRARWRQLLADRLGVGIDLEAALHGRLNAELVVS